MHPAKAALDQTVARSVPMVLAGSGAFYALLFAGVALLAPPDAVGGDLRARWVAMAGLGVAGAAAAARWGVPQGWANALVGSYGILVALSGLHVVAVLGPAMNFALLVCILGFSLFLLSLPWAGAVVGTAVVGWTFLAAQAGWGPEWVPRTVNLAAIGFVGLIAQANRVRLHLRLERLRAAELDRERQEAALARERALHEQRIRIVRMTAHELATPLTPVLLQAHLLARSGLEPRQREHLETLQRNLERLRASIERVVRAARADEEASRHFAAPALEEYDTPPRGGPGP